MDRNKTYVSIIEEVLNSAGITKYRYADVKNGLYEKRLCSKECEMIYLFNSADTEKSVRIEENGYLLEGVGIFEDGILTIPPQAVTILAIKN